MLADRLCNRCFAKFETDFGLEPLPVGFHQADKRNRSVAKTRGQTDDVVKAHFRCSIKDVLCIQHVEPIALIHRISCVCSRLLTGQCINPCERDCICALTDRTILVSSARRIPVRFAGLRSQLRCCQRARAKSVTRPTRCVPVRSLRRKGRAYASYRTRMTGPPQVPAF